MPTRRRSCGQVHAPAAAGTGSRRANHRRARIIAPMEAPTYSTARVGVVRIPDGAANDVVAVEEPLEIHIGGMPVAVTMRTPGHDEELALGFALSEGQRPSGARAPDDLAANTIELDAADFDPERLRRSFYTSSSCGVCGKGALEAVAVEAPRVASSLHVAAEL